MVYDYDIRPKWILTQWKAFVVNRNHLGDGNAKGYARLLFAALKELPKEDVLILSEKYYETEQGANFSYMHNGYRTYIPITDKVLADRRGISVLEYRKIRSKSEAKLQAIINRLRKEFIEIDADELEEYILGVGTIYLKDYQIIEGKRADPDSYIFTQDRSKAKRFKQDSTQGNQLKMYLRLKKMEPRDEYIKFIDIWFD
ncbi:hypothetical protein [Enterococcus innesii]|uniref:hypothetical protein n=1 Tax=Enterococcus innesii TaxID=2839759 RepID=UPI00232EA383|nr:hypothetical protein [Enterococcus innesii]MDC0751211.1 hypothetical protein [Enterococcus innesii]MDC0775298.1 hypothetical protein [Enterococcus innesii]MDC0778558.1 hypothetical protein [Enterococcus innesii]MDC0782058.1 hypothetical protein [Enterococcus innesii]